MDDRARPYRSVLYIPGSKARALEKAKGLPVDAIIFALEDALRGRQSPAALYDDIGLEAAVAPDEQANARKLLMETLAAGGYGARSQLIRINGFDSAWGTADFEAAVAIGPQAILLPKVIKAADVARVAAMLDTNPACRETKIWAMMETAEGILNAAEIARAPRMGGFILGTNDLAKELRGVNDPTVRKAIQPSLGLSVAAARAYDLLAIDGVFNGIGDEEGLSAECQQGRLMGFDGKTLIHPSQLDVANRIFAPAEEDVDQAKAVIEAFADPANAGKGVLKVNGKMTELLHLEEAQRTVAVADAIAAMAG